MSKEILIIIVAILILLFPYGLAKFNGTEKELVGWAESFLPKSAATSTTQQSSTSETDLWVKNSTGV